MKQLLDFIPLVVFFIFYKFYDLFAATKALMVASCIALFLIWLLQRRLEKMQLVAFGFVMVFGALTLWFHNTEFIKWKVTIIYTLFAIALLVSQMVMKKPLIKSMLGKELTLPDAVWQRLNIAWALFFFACGLLNLYIAFRLPEDLWVQFKSFGLTGLTLIYTLLSGVYIYRQMPEKEK